MKMQYTKPMLYAESFTLVEHITQCAHLNSATSGSPEAGCGFALNGRDANGNLLAPILFVIDAAGTVCTDSGDPSLVDTGAGGDGIGMLCYNYFVDEGTQIFQS